jgi:hypothetical protein
MIVRTLSQPGRRERGDASRHAVPAAGMILRPAKRIPRDARPPSART